MYGTGQESRSGGCTGQRRQKAVMMMTMGAHLIGTGRCINRLTGRWVYRLPWNVVVVRVPVMSGGSGVVVGRRCRMVGDGGCCSMVRSQRFLAR